MMYIDECLGFEVIATWQVPWVDYICVHASIMVFAFCIFYVVVALKWFNFELGVL